MYLAKNVGSRREKEGKNSSLAYPGRKTGFSIRGAGMSIFRYFLATFSLISPEPPNRSTPNFYKCAFAGTKTDLRCKFQPY